MPKTNWLRVETYQRLDALREKRETFNEVVNRLCNVFEMIRAIPDTLGPSHFLREHPLGGKTIEK